MYQKNLCRTGRGIKKILTIIGPTVLFCLLLFVFFQTVHAQGTLGGDWAQYLEGDLKSFGEAGQSGEQAAAGAVRRGIGIVKYGMGGIALIFGIIYAMALVFARGREEVITKQKQNFLYVFIGFVIIMAAEQISNIFNPEKAEADKLIDFGAGRDQLRDIINYFKWIFGSIIVLLMTVSGIRMITASGNEETITKEKRHLVWSGIGMLVILLANNIVSAIYVVNEDTGATTAAQAETGITEIAGVIRLILAFLGPVAVAFTIYAGFMYLTALENEDRANKAKRMIVAGVTGIVIIYASFALVNTLVGQKTEEKPSLEQEITQPEQPQTNLLLNEINIS